VVITFNMCRMIIIITMMRLDDIAWMTLLIPLSSLLVEVIPEYIVNTGSSCLSPKNK